MNILIDGHMIDSDQHGNARYIKNLFKSLRLLNKANIFLYKGEKHESDIYRLTIGIPKKVKEIQADIVHSTYITPFIKNAKFVNTIHDFSFRKHSEFYTAREKLMFKYLLPLSLKQSDAVIVPSDFSKREGEFYYPNHKHKFTVTPEASDSNFYPIVKSQVLSYVETEFQIKYPFCLALNTNNKKNIDAIISSFIAVKKEVPEQKLVIVSSKNIKQLDNKPYVKILRNVTDKQLNYLYNACSLFIFYSAYEGFGLPVLEAAQCNCAILLSDIPVHREITMSKLIYVSPIKTKQLSDAILAILSSKRLSKHLAKEAGKIASIYSWKNTANKTMKLYKTLL